MNTSVLVMGQGRTKRGELTPPPKEEAQKALPLRGLETRHSAFPKMSSSIGLN